MRHIEDPVCGNAGHIKFYRIGIGEVAFCNNFFRTIGFHFVINRGLHLDGDFIRISQRTVDGNRAGDGDFAQCFVQNDHGTECCPIHIRAESDRVVFLKGLCVGDGFPQTGLAVVSIHHINIRIDRQREIFHQFAHGADKIFTVVSRPFFAQLVGGPFGSGHDIEDIFSSLTQRHIFSIAGEIDPIIRAAVTNKDLVVIGIVQFVGNFHFVGNERSAGIVFDPPKFLEINGSADRHVLHVCFVVQEIPDRTEAAVIDHAEHRIGDIELVVPVLFFLREGDVVIIRADFVSEDDRVGDRDGVGRRKACEEPAAHLCGSIARNGQVAEIRVTSGSTIVVRHTAAVRGTVPVERGVGDPCAVFAAGFIGVVAVGVGKVKRTANTVFTGCFIVGE